MAEDTTTETEETTSTETETGNDVEKQAFLDRLNKESGKRKEAEKAASELSKRLKDIETQMQEREEAGLPELERERKRAEALEKRVADAETAAEEATRKVALTERRSMVLSAAAKAGFDDPTDATRYPEIVNLDDIEDAEQAESAVKRLAKTKPRLLKDEETKLPGRVLENGRTTTDNNRPTSPIDQNAEAQSIADELKKFSQNWSNVGG